MIFFFFSSRRRHTRLQGDWSSDVCSSDLVNIDAVADLKFDAAAKQVSQFEPAVNKYRPDWQPADLAKAKDEMRREQPKKDGRSEERRVGKEGRSRWSPYH